MKSIKFKIMVLSLSLLVVAILAISVNSVLSTYNSTLFALEESMNATIDATSDMVEVQLESYTKSVDQLSTDPILSQEIPNEGETTAEGKTRQDVVAEMSARFAEITQSQGYDAMQVFDKNGIALTINADYSNDLLFTAPRDTGKAYVADPTISPESGLLTMPITAPIMRDGEFHSVVLVAINPEVFSNIVSSVSLGEGSSTTIINSQGITIAYNEIQYVMDEYNLIEDAKTDTSLKDLAVVEQNLMQGQEGFAQVTWDGVAQFAAYTQVDGSNGWGIYILTNQSNFLAQMNSSIITTLILSVVLIAAAAFIIIMVANKISKPIKLCAERLDGVSKGDLKTPMPDVQTKDETGVLAESTASIVNSVSVMIEDLNYTLAELAAGNFTVKSKAKEYYVGDFATLSVSLDTIIEKLSDTMHRITDVSYQVNSGNDQVASGAQSLAQGSIEQASSIDSLSRTVEEIVIKISETAQDSQTALKANAKSQEALMQSNEQMHEMVDAMGRISEKSIEISKIIKAIDDIAFQTNILALNAAVEAARAGVAGKGFAVVADEVRTLASKSAESAKSTAVLIEQTVEAVEIGNRIVSSTSESINTAIENANELSSLVDGIAVASAAQADGANQINAGIEQISAVIQTNSATAEESAATSQELSGQSNILQELLSEFKLDD